MSISPFVRYYYLHRGPFNLYVDGNVGYSYETSKGDSHHGFEAVSYTHLDVYKRQALEQSTLLRLATTADPL